ncbi:MAG: aspartate aminotransferase family protein [Candidatus Dormiibacter spiritus]|nr:MAG: aspartate aminotransferase family protein [Candidatus Dormibacteraeota bacterium]
MDVDRRLPITVVSGSGCMLRSASGKQYLDLVAGIAVNLLGYSHPALVEAICSQASRLINAGDMVHTEAQIELARQLVELTFPSRAFFCHSGAEANEAAIKLARKWGKLRKAGAYEIVTAVDSFHGRTLAAVTAGGRPRNSDPFTPLPPGFLHVPFNDIEGIRRVTNSNTAAVMLEPILGSAGVIPASAGYLREVRQWCDENHLLLIFDEVQTGLGRTGSWFAFEKYGVKPDIVTIAKGLGGGVPIGACLASPAADVFVPGDHGSTVGGNALACAAAFTVLQTIESESLVENAASVGAYLAAGLRTLAPQEVRGTGLMLAMDLRGPVARALQEKCLEMGLLINVIGDRTVRFVPPLILTRAEVDTAVEVMASALAALEL